MEEKLQAHAVEHVHWQRSPLTQADQPQLVSAAGNVLGAILAVGWFAGMEMGC